MTTTTLVREAVQSSATSLMNAWCVHEFGPPEAMLFETMPRPEPGPGEVLVKVHAAGVGPWDGWIRAGRSALPQPLPLTCRSFQVLRLGGKLISAVSEPDQDRARHHGVTAAFFLVEVTTERLGRIAELIDRGELIDPALIVLNEGQAAPAGLS